MRLLYLLLLSIVISMTPLSAQEQKVHKKLPLSESLPLLHTIEDQAIRMGDGPVAVHIFVDPLCPHSRNFVEMIVESDKMRSKYSYYFYLYTLKRMHSEAVVAAIYDSSDPLKMMVDIMVEKKKVDTNMSADAKKAPIIKTIENVGERLNVYKRPYMIMVKKPKKKRGK